MVTARSDSYAAASGGGVFAGISAHPLGAMGLAASAMSGGEWLDWTSSTAAADLTGTDPVTAAAIGWLEGHSDQRPLMNWPGNITWDLARKRIVAVGATNGLSSESPAGEHSCLLALDVVTGDFSREWNPVGQNIGHQYDANSTAPASGYLYRRAYATGNLYRLNLSAGTWAYVFDSGTEWGGTNFGSSQAPSLEYFPTLGASGSIIVVASGGRVARYDIATDAKTVINSTALTGVGGPEVVCAYHPGIDAIVFGGGNGGTRLYKLDNTGTVSSFVTSFPTGVTEIGPRDAVSTVLAPDPQGRAYAWLFDPVQTTKVWRLDLGTQAWADSGACSSQANTCFATIPELGVHVGLDSRGRSGGASLSRVWLFKPA